jgi:mono/diheme cytochrome c family protein
MPAFGATHKDEEIWRVALFVQRLPKITEEDYAKMEQQ